VLLLLRIGSGSAADATRQPCGQDSIRAESRQEDREGAGHQLKRFDLLLARHKGEQTDALANVLVQEASLYLPR